MNAPAITNLMPDEVEDPPSPAAVEVAVEQEPSQQQEASQPVEQVEVELRVHNISRDDLRHLESLLTQWALRHKTTYAEGYPAELQLLSGLLALDVGRLRSEGVVDWRDTVRAVEGSGRLSASATAAGYEQAEAPPAYDRAIDELLAPPVDPSAAAAGQLPGGAAAARRRQQAEACLVTEGCGADDTPAKRRRLPAQRCFNCGSYAHGIQQCLKPHDQARVAAARAEVQAARGAGVGGPNLLGRRYFEGGGQAGPYEGLAPGRISEQLAAALGLADTSAPPPWLSRQVALGVPPRYTADAVAGPGGGTDLFGFINCSDGEGEEDEDAAAGSEDEGGEQQQQQNGEHKAAAAAATPGVLLPGLTCPIPAAADQQAWQTEIDKGTYLAQMLKV